MKHPRTDILYESVADSTSPTQQQEQQQHNFNKSVKIQESRELQHESTFFKHALYFLLFTILNLGYKNHCCQFDITDFQAHNFNRGKLI